MADKSQKLWSNVFIATDEGKKLFLLIFRFWPFFTYFLTCTCDLLLLCRISFLYSFEMSHLFIFSLKVFYPTKNTAWKRYTPDYFFAFNIYCITRLKYNTFIQNTNWRIYKGIYILIWRLKLKWKYPCIFQKYWTITILCYC